MVSFRSHTERRTIAERVTYLLYPISRWAPLFRLQGRVVLVGNGLYRQLRFVLVKMGERLSILALEFSHIVLDLFLRYLRTPSRAIVSEATIMNYLRKSIFRLFAHNPNLPITKIIKSKQENVYLEHYSLIS